MRFNLRRFTSQRSVLNNIAFQNDRTVIGTNTAAALAQARGQLLDPNNGARRGVRSVFVVMTDGQSNINTRETLAEARRARDRGTRVLAVGIGGRVNRGEVEGLASDPARGVFYAPTERDLQRVADRLLEAICT